MFVKMTVTCTELGLLEHTCSSKAE